ncbi:hypothetical protein [Bacillus pumilus]|uniref:Uncharacterized protein n=1 Tax=Bacillus pumilus TaxID=1408 RepID=A0AAD0ML32_BACPU|nr:hypothetical protein [Bacillus pumilus]AVM24237.1 hypothetical protein C5695_10450 [Bacillus pumilus]TYS42852.1 hypothetical protein FZC68_10630 [Bacillus pumilus]
MKSILEQINSLKVVHIDLDNYAIYVKRNEQVIQLLHTLVKDMTVEEYIKSFMKDDLIDLIPAVIGTGLADGYKQGEGFVSETKRFYMKQCYELDSRIEYLEKLVVSLGGHPNMQIVNENNLIH